MLVADGARPHARYDHGPLFHAAAGVLYAVLLLGLGITAVAAFMAPRPLRPMMMILLFGTATPIVANIGYVAFDVEILGFDPTPFAFSFVLLALTWVIYATRGFDLGTMARDLLYYTNKEPVLVVNANGMVSNANPAARALLPDAVPGQPIDPAGPLAALGPGADRPPGSDGRQEIAIGARTFTMRVLPINRPLSRAGGRLAEIVILTDVTDAKAKQARLAEALALTNQQLAEITRLREIAERLALADPLTGIGNRRSLMVRIEELRKRPCALALIDLDHFKRINDRLGHSVGDRVLRDFTALLRGLLPDGAELFRVGGEEFVLLMPDAAISDLLAVLNRFNAALIEMPSLRDNDHHRVSFSAGVAVRPGDGDTFDALYGRADARLYQAKRAGRSRVMHLDCLSFPAEVASTPPTDERAPRLDHQ